MAPIADKDKPAVPPAGSTGGRCAANAGAASCRRRSFARLGGASLEIENTGATASDTSGLTTGQLRRVFVFAVAGGAAGLLAGVLADRRR